MLRRYKWFLLLIVVPVLLFATLQVPWGSSVERAILAELEFDAQSVPRRASGRIDFVRILDDASYLSPEENCLVDIARLFGMDMDPPPVNIMQALGNPAILPPGERITEIDEFYRGENPGATEEQLDAIYFVYQRPWTGIDLPEGEQWIRQYSQRIDELHRASTRKGYYHPYRDNGNGLLVGVLLPSVQRMRSASRVLSARAMYHLGNGQTTAAMDDLIANKKLAAKLSSAPLLVEQLVGVAMHGIGHQGVCQLLGRELSQDQIRRLQTEFSADQSSTTSNDPCRSEKLFALDVIDMAAKGGFGSDAIGLQLDPRLQFLLAMRGTVDWEVAANVFTEFYEKIDAASNINNDIGRMEQLQQALTEIENARAQLQGTGVAVRLLAGARSRGMIAGHMMMEFLIPSLDTVGTAITRKNVQCDLISLATAVELYRLKHDRYPEQLEELVPEFIDGIPIDRFNGGPVNFAITDSHYFISSAGPDGKNDLQTLIPLEDPQDHRQFDDSHSWVKVRRK